MNHSADLFLLLLNLSQMRSRDKVIELFTGSLGTLFPPLTFQYASREPAAPVKGFPIATRSSSYGYIVLTQQQPLSEEIQSLLHNAIQMFAVILERLALEKNLEEAITSVEGLANERLNELLATVEQLRESRSAYINLVEDLTREIETRRRAEAELRTSEEQNRTILKTAMDGFWLVDKQNRLVEVNDAYCRMSGYSKPELLAMKHTDLSVKPADEISAIQERIAEHGHGERFESLHRRKDGSLFEVEVCAQYQPDSEKIVVFMHDITERKRNQAELLKSDKLQSIGTLAGGIAHDFNNILLGLFGNISIAMDDLPKDHPSYAPLEEAEKSMSRAVRLTKQLLTFAKGGDPVKESISLGAMVTEVARFDLTGSNVSLICQPAEDVWPVDADRGQIQQVVSNLVINARQAMPNGGCLIVTLENANLPAEAVPTLKHGRYVKVSVRDEGEGISPKVIDHIFDPYFTTKQTGNGLGLATVWSILRKHNGHINVVSELGKGTTFTFYLPAATSPQSAEAKPTAAECPPTARTAKILVMDDEEMVCGLAARMLTRCGYSVSTATNGQETIALYRQALESGAPFDAVIMDLTIPGGPGGKEVIKDLLALDPNVRALVSSGYADDPVMANPAAYGFKGTAAKPYTANALREAVSLFLT